MTTACPAKRISQQQLSEIDLRLSDRDRQILCQLDQLRYLRTNQVQRLFFHDSARTNRASLTATMRTLDRLKRHGLITHLTRQIGGVYHGSAGKVWHMTEAGMRLLDLGKESDGKRKRALEPSQALLRHTLAVSECFVQLTEICRSRRSLVLKTLDIEPACWRAYQKNGKDVSLRPDLYAEIVSGQYEDRWFIEMDLDTESTSDIVEKCRRYQQYCQTDLEQKANGVFPLVLWIVPTEERRQKMIDAIRMIFGNRHPHINLIITPESLKTVITEGAKEEDLC